MFVVDDILLSPFKGFMWMVREIHKAAAQEQENEAQALTTRLSSLYMMLETGQITPEQFDEQERSILARLEQIEGTVDAGGVDGDGGGDEDEADDGDDDAPEDDGPEAGVDAGDESDDDEDSDEGEAGDDLAALMREELREEMNAELEGGAPAPDRDGTPRTEGEQP